MTNFFKYIVASNFIADYCPGIKNYKKKLSGKASNGKDITFTDEDWKIIMKGFKKLVKDLTKK